MSKFGYYAVKVGKNPGVYYDKDEYKAQMEGFPCAEGRRFANEKEAWDYIYGFGTAGAESNKPTPAQPPPPPAQKKKKNKPNPGPPLIQYPLPQRYGMGHCGLDMPGPSSYDRIRSYELGRGQDFLRREFDVDRYRDMEPFQAPGFDFGGFGPRDPDYFNERGSGGGHETEDVCTCDTKKCDQGRALVISGMKRFSEKMCETLELLTEKAKVLNEGLDQLNDENKVKELLPKVLAKKRRRQEEQGDELKRLAEEEAKRAAEEEEEERAFRERIAKREEEETAYLKQKTLEKIQQAERRRQKDEKKRQKREERLKARVAKLAEQGITPGPDTWI